MRNAPDHLIFESASRGNILPVTSTCNVSCVFCSHKQNPPGLDVYRMTSHTLEKAEELLQFFDPQQKIVIGESVTRIIEGEPFVHPQIRDILLLVRKRFPLTEIQITSNGSLIDREMADFLAKLGRIELNLSLNSADTHLRSTLMHDRLAAASVEAARCLADAGVPFHGSIVAMPHLVGWDDLGVTAAFLAGSGAKTIRVFMPGFTKYAPANLQFGPELREQLAEYVDKLGDIHHVPMTIEPPLIKDLRAEVRGVMAGSPAARAGLKKGDVIQAVDGHTCFSRVEAFQRVRDNGSSVIEIVREGQSHFLQIEKESRQVSGLVMDFDIDPGTVKEIDKSLKRRRGALLASELGAPILEMALQGSKDSGELMIYPVKNSFFGGSIMSAGLLTVEDFKSAIDDLKEDFQPQVILLPALAFDRRGRDLLGQSYLDIEPEVEAAVEII